LLFASFDFLLFFVPVLVAYWGLGDRPRARTLLLIGASYFFYVASPEPVGGGLPPPWYYVGLLVFSTWLDFLCAGRIHAHATVLADPDPRTAAAARRRRTRWLAVSLVGNLGLLGYFKYTNFFVEAFVELANGFGADWLAPHLDLLLPIGISFYTFQSLSYTIDVWRGRLEPEPSFARFALFVVFFPQLVAGPIVRASELLPQLRSRPSLDLAAVHDGAWRIWKGLAKKVILGDWIAASFADAVFTAPESHSSLENLVALYAFTLQIYADFSGYSDIAIGTARLLGFRIPENFDRPYQSRSVGEFWRRWHMTLSTWLRDYLFFPLGGSKGSPARTYFNLWLTMFLVGMWHQQPTSGWNFVIYANLHAGAMLFNRWNRLRDRTLPASRKVPSWLMGAGLVGGAFFVLGHHVLDLPLAGARDLGIVAGVAFIGLVVLPETGTPANAALHVALTFQFTVVSRVFFRADDFRGAKSMCAQLVGWDGLGVRPGFFRIPWATDWVDTQLAGAVPDALHAAARGLAEHGMLLVLVAGLAYHWTPRRWVDDLLARGFARLPAPLVGLSYALLALVLMKLLAGPRANIYFAF
jgi:D-alanyl-lipoteichoic acid acyltransferase DltB (MBOAT superfamily)